MASKKSRAGHDQLRGGTSRIDYAAPTRPQLPTTVVTNASPSTTSSAKAKITKLQKQPALERASSQISRSSDESLLSDYGRQFIATVGPGSKAHQRPSRKPVPQQIKRLPTTPPNTARSDLRPTWQSNRGQSDSPSAWTPKVRGPVNENNVPVPPLSLANSARRRKARSYSASTTSDTSIAWNAMDAGIELQPMLYGGDRMTTKEQRRKSSQDVNDGLIHLQIPHYRLGTPHFGERGTAYFHNSFYTSSITDDNRSSVLTQQQFDRLFPLPPGVKAAHRLSSQPSHDWHYSHRSSHRNSPLNFWQSTANDGPTSIFDRVEANPNDPAIVRFAYQQPRVLAATIPRLIVQITSTHFLDYELLSDFFLTYRGFMSSQELLDWLIVRMRWAILSPTDTGRIVRVRTFVALRHWILNYFADDFVSNIELRRSFCESINQLCRDVSHRKDSVGDLNIISELKKCWRRTSAQFWPVYDAMDAGPLDNIHHTGGEEGYSSSAAYDAGKNKTLRQSWIDTYHKFPASSQLVALDRRSNQTARVASIITNASRAWVQRSSIRSSIPASPMSEDSLHVISCAIPFLYNIRPDARAEKRAERSAPRPVLPHRRNSLKDDGSAQKPKLIESGHRRGHSRNESGVKVRAPVTPTRQRSVAVEDMPDITLTAGLIRGLVLQPSPAFVGLYAPKSPPIEPLPKLSRRKSSDSYFDDDDDGVSTGVRRLVGDMRRALSVKKSASEASTRSQHSHHGSSSQNSQASSHDGPAPRSEPSMDRMTNNSATSRKDVLAARIEISYTQHFTDQYDNGNIPADNVVKQPGYLDINKSLPRPPSPNSWRAMTLSDTRDRLNSDITATSRSIVIMDATSVPGSSPHQPPGMSPSSQLVRSSPLTNTFAQFDFSFSSRSGSLATDMSAQRYLPPEVRQEEASPLNARLQSAFAAPTPLNFRVPDASQDGEPYVRSASANDNPLIHARSPNQLRRRPGGDLRAADHVRQLEPFHFQSGESTPGPSRNSADTFDLSRSSYSTAGKREKLVRSASAISAKSAPLLDRPTSQPLINPAVSSQLSGLKLVQQNGIGDSEDALARLEGKTAGRGHMHKSSVTSWLEPSPQEEIGEVDKTRKRAAFFGQPASSTNAALQSVTMTETSDEIAGFPVAKIPDGQSADPSQQFVKAIVTPAVQTRNGDTQSANGVIIAPAGPGAHLDGPLPIIAASQDEEAPNQIFVSASAVQSSFLLADNESLSDIATDLTSDDESAGARSFFLDENGDEMEPDQPVKAQPVLLSKTLLDELSSEQDKDETQDPGASRAPLKIATSAAKILGIPADTIISEIIHTRSKSVRAILNEGDHMPFVLAFESDVIAEQLCIIEKDALDEIDWKDLISLNWQHTPPQVRDWVEYLKRPGANGVDLVIARFNLAVKWVVSECVLTQSIGERARCIGKYIHIASHCLRLRNYASMYQITLALLSSDLARLRQTWSLVTTADKRMLDRLEKLCQPIRNFHNLRIEMEDSAHAAEGCIPFIGLYTHDLTFNAQKPAQLQPVQLTDIGPPLINFERYQTAASITKGLLRLLEASAKYQFKANPEVLSRCLWLAALDDADIHELALNLD